MVGTVDDNPDRPEARRLRFRIRHRAWTQVAMAARLREHAVADEEPRAMQQALSNRLLVAPIQAASVAHGGKAVSQRFLNLAGDFEEANWQRSAALLGDVADDAQMRVRIDQSGHQHTSGRLDFDDAISSRRSAAA